LAKVCGRVGADLALMLSHQLGQEHGLSSIPAQDGFVDRIDEGSAYPFQGEPASSNAW
jgi:hypothetical protein